MNNLGKWCSLVLHVLMENRVTISARKQDWNFLFWQALIWNKTKENANEGESMELVSRSLIVWSVNSLQLIDRNLNHTHPNPVLMLGLNNLFFCSINLTQWSLLNFYIHFYEYVIVAIMICDVSYLIWMSYFSFALL